MCHYSKKRQFAKPVRSGQVPETGLTRQVGIKPASLYWRCTARAPARCSPGSSAIRVPRAPGAGDGAKELLVKLGPLP
jgi:hypothetical protein